MALGIKLLEQDDVDELWPKLEPLVRQACEGNEFSAAVQTPEDIYLLARTGQCAVFVGFEDDEPAMVMALQFHVSNGKKGVDIIGLAGRDLLKFKRAYWEPILQWLRANDVLFVDAYATHRLANIYLNKFGFDSSCTYVRMSL